MTTATVPTGPSVTTGSAARVAALALTELKLIVRNRTVAVASLVVPLGLGIFWSVSFGGDPTQNAAVIALQMAVTFGIAVYQGSTQILVARRHEKVLKRMRTSGVPDGGLLVGTLAPSIALGVVQLAVFAAVDAVTGRLTVGDPLPLVFAAVAGIALAVTAALATSIITPSPERTQLTTLPLTIVMLAGAVVLSIAPVAGWWQAAVVLPGTGFGLLAQLAVTGQTWAPGVAGLPAVLPALLSTLAWPVVFGVLAARRFRWDPRH